MSHVRRLTRQPTPGDSRYRDYSFAGAAFFPGFDRPVVWPPVAGDRDDLGLPAADGPGVVFTELPRRSAEELARDLSLDSFHDCAAVDEERSSTVGDR